MVRGYALRVHGVCQPKNSARHYLPLAACARRHPRLKTARIIALHNRGGGRDPDRQVSPTARRPYPFFPIKIAAPEQIAYTLCWPSASI